ncbi:sulfite exporter TauE/SafE family protein [Candidatus Binatia bacterium]|nr:sulfite exporter TauE/SafE family protein [Candidatus Binatia bacterium]
MIRLLLALPIGGALVLLGAGGSILTVPLLVYGLGLDVREAAGTSLLVVGVVALVGAVTRWRAVHARVGATFGLAGIVGAVPGAWLNHHVPAAAVLAGFGATVILVALRLTRPLPAPRAGQHAVAALIAGFAGGVATGFFGVGGGFLIVPALTVLLGLDMGAAVATSLLVIALNSLGALVAHAAYGTVVWSTGIEVALAALLGAALAWPLGVRVGQHALQRAFVVCLIFLGAGILLQGLGRLLG